jgi:dipeptidyl aminopeptidase/acylaminoacyl peptidase
MRFTLPTVALLAFASMLHPVNVRASTFSMAGVLSAPFVDNLTASPDGTVLVWKVHLRGMRNLYTNAGGAVHKITDYDSDDGQDIDNVAITPKDDAVVYMRGGTQDNAGDDNINPLSLIPPPIRGVYIVGINGGKPILVGEGSQVTLSPAGSAVAWVTSAGALQISTLARSAAGYSPSKPETLVIRGQVGNLAWSPDGTCIAFTNYRKAHSFIVIYTPQEEKYVYAAPDFTSDDGAAWSPDGSRVAFVRVPGDRDDESPYSTPAQDPWSILVADARTGKGHSVWQAHRGTGVEFYTTSNNYLWWMSGNRIAFPWEGDGWEHLYQVSAHGGGAKILTAGAFDVETVAESLDRTALIYATNEGDIDRRHIWQVGTDGQPRALTSGTDDQWSPTPMANGGFAYVNAGYNVPPMVTIGGRSATVIVGESTPANFPSGDFVQPQLVTFRAPDGLLIHAQLFLPRSGSAKHAAIIFVHGGPERQMLPGFHYFEAYTNLYESNQYLANRGFIVLSINYRGGIMYGHDFRVPRAYWNARGYQDVLAGAHWLDHRSDVDPKRLGVYGLSFGGYFTAMALARNSDLFKAGSDYAGVDNLVAWIDGFNGGIPLGTAAQRKQMYEWSPVASLDRWRSPVFLSQGDDDRNSPFTQGVDLATRLRDRGVHVETMAYPNEPHENQVWSELVEQYQASTDFLIRQLNP